MIKRKAYYHTNIKINGNELVLFAFDEEFTKIDMIVSYSKFNKMWPILKATYDLKFIENAGIRYE